jgi:hypothetical protein
MSPNRNRHRLFFSEQVENDFCCVAAERQGHRASHPKV